MPPGPDEHELRRAFVVVIDALGVGAEPDAGAYGDAGAHTLRHLAEAVGGLRVPALQSLGLGDLGPVRGVPRVADPALHGILHHQGPGKDSTTGHWELMGVILDAPLPAFPRGLSPELLGRLEAATGRRLCGGEAVDGLVALERHGPHHLRTGELIAYTSVDSVVQLAAHTGVATQTELEDACAAARIELRGADGVGRVIARPFRGEPGAFQRTDGRRDFTLPPPSRSHLDALADAGVPVHAVGKVDDLFAGRGITQAHRGATNAEAIAALDDLVGELDEGLVFANLIETDQRFGHRKDVEGFHAALREIDTALARVVGVRHRRIDPVIGGDHQQIPGTQRRQPPRERVPLLARFAGDGGRRADGPMANVGASVLRWLTGEDDPAIPGTPFT
jgi:phosphopentomutase